MNKSGIVASGFVLLSFILVMAGASHRLREKEKEVVCRTNLRQWGTAFQIDCRCRKGWALAPGGTAADWIAKVRGDLDPRAAFCPSVSPDEGGYRLNLGASPDSRLRFSEAFPANTVLLFDGKCGGMLSGTEPHRETANRHSGGTNLLFLDGSILCRAARTEGLATEEIGWNNQGGYIWSLEPASEK